MIDEFRFFSKIILGRIDNTFQTAPTDGAECDKNRDTKDRVWPFRFCFILKGERTKTKKHWRCCTARFY